MSCYEWEAGTLLLPSAAFTQVKNGVIKVAQDHWKSAFDKTQEFWKLIPAKAKKDATVYNEWKNHFLYGNVPGRWNYNEKMPRRQPLEPQLNSDRNSLTEDVDYLLDAACPWQGTPRRVLKSDLPTLNNKTTQLHCGEADITFDRERRTVRWNVPENNHARDYCRDHPIAKALFSRLDRLNWTRGSGGVIVANNEYNRDSEYVGGGGNFIVSAYGPRGKQALKRPAVY